MRTLTAVTTLIAVGALIAVLALGREHAIKAAVSAKVEEVFFAEGELVEEGAELLRLTPLADVPAEEVS